MLPNGRPREVRQISGNFARAILLRAAGKKDLDSTRPWNRLRSRPRRSCNLPPTVVAGVDLIATDYSTFQFLKGNSSSRRSPC
jgi:hypothetical protein